MFGRRLVVVRKSLGLPVEVWVLQSRHQVDPAAGLLQKMNPVFQAEEVLQKKTQAAVVHQRMSRVAPVAGEPQKTNRVEVAVAALQRMSRVDLVAAALQRRNQVWEEALPRNLRVAVVETCRAPKGHCSGGGKTQDASWDDVRVNHQFRSIYMIHEAHFRIRQRIKSKKTR